MIKVSEIIVYVSPDIDHVPSAGADMYGVDVVRKTTFANGTHKVAARRHLLDDIEQAKAYQKAAMDSRFVEAMVPAGA